MLILLAIGLMISLLISVQAFDTFALFGLLVLFAAVLTDLIHGRVP
ncbi:MAG: hypothetical protein ACO3RL_08990 [Vulcanococcus sp.]